MRHICKKGAIFLQKCCIADFRDKEVINICDGRRLGHVTDVEFDICDGRIIAIILPGEGGFLGIGGCDIAIEWCKIKQIGEDIILVDIGPFECPPRDCCDKDKKKRKLF